MMPIALLYHDVVDERSEPPSGFSGPIAARYKAAMRRLMEAEPTG